MIAAIMLLSLIGSVVLIGVCAPLSTGVSPTPPPIQSDTAPYSSEEFLPDPHMNWNTLFENSEVNSDMTSESIKDAMRQGIVEKSIQILRNHGKSDEEIRDILLKDFCISPDALDELLNAEQK